MTFIQLIEFKTTRFDEMQPLMEEWLRTTEGRRTAQRTSTTADRDHPNTYVQIVEFNSYEEAMANSKLPDTDAFARRLADMCDAPPVFRNLDVSQVVDLT
jgi:hypothetical protein